MQIHTHTHRQRDTHTHTHTYQLVSERPTGHEEEEGKDGSGEVALEEGGDWGRGVATASSPLETQFI